MGGLTRARAALTRVRAIDSALLLLAAMVFIAQVGIAVMLPLLPLYARQLGAAPTVLGLLTSVFAVTNAAGQLLTGFLAERFAMRRVLAVGIGSYAAANFLIATAATAGMLVVFRGAAGLGGGVMLVGERLYLAQLVEPARLAFANGVLAAAGSAGSVAGPAIGGLLAAAGDLRLPFLLVGVTSLTATIGALFLPRPRSETSTPDGEVVTASAAIEPSVEHVEPSVEHAERSDEHLEPSVAAPRVSDRRRLGVLLLSQMALSASFGSFITTYAPFAEDRLGWPTAEIGIVFALFGLGAITVGPWLGRQADRRGRRNVGVLGLLPVLAFAAVYWLELPRPFLYASAVAAGAGITGYNAAWYALLGDATGGGRRSRRFGAVAALGNLGIIVGATAASQLWEALADVSIGLVVAFVATALAGIVMMFLPADRPPAGAADGST